MHYSSEARFLSILLYCNGAFKLQVGTRYHITLFSFFSVSIQHFYSFVYICLKVMTQKIYKCFERKFLFIFDDLATFGLQ